MPVDTRRIHQTRASRKRATYALMCASWRSPTKAAPSSPNTPPFAPAEFVAPPGLEEVGPMACPRQS